MSARQLIDIAMTDADGVYFKTKVRAEFYETPEGAFVVQRHDLGLTAHGETLKEASIMFKDMFLILAKDLHYKGKHTALTGKERERLATIHDVCDIR